MIVLSHSNSSHPSVVDRAVLTLSTAAWCPIYTHKAAHQLEVKQELKKVCAVLEDRTLAVISSFHFLSATVTQAPLT